MGFCGGRETNGAGLLGRTKSTARKVGRRGWLECKIWYTEIKGTSPSRALSRASVNHLVKAQVKNMFNLYMKTILGV